MLNKKAISNAIATTILLALALTSALTFFNWNDNNLTKIFSNTQQKTQENLQKAQIEILKIDKTHLHIKSQTTTNSTKTLLINNQECSITKNITKGINKFNISKCLTPKTHKINIKLILNQNSYKKQFYLK